MFTTSIPDLKGMPLASRPALYLYLGLSGRVIPWEIEGWQIESMSWKTGCYIHAGLSDFRTNFEGPGAKDFLESICVNAFKSFGVGMMRHAVMCTDAGLIASHAILQRNSDTSFSMFAAGLPWSEYVASKTRFDVKANPIPSFLHQVAGPTSLIALERATGERLRDLGFLRFRMARIAGLEVEIARIGMSGNLAFEVRGPLDQGPPVYAAVMKAGADLGIHELGWRTYFVNHVEGGFPQAGWTFYSAGLDDPGFRSALGPRAAVRVTGSVDPANMRARYRTPLEVGWQKAIKLDHEFIGRKAVEAELVNPSRTVVTLRWNPEDVLDIHASLLRPGETYMAIDMPVTPTWQHGFFAHADHVQQGGKEIGFSSGTTYSYYFREVISMATIDIDRAEVGKEVVVQWGNHGQRLKSVRAMVAEFPYLQEWRNDKVDLTAMGG